VQGNLLWWLCLCQQSVSNTQSCEAAAWYSPLKLAGGAKASAPQNIVHNKLHTWSTMACGTAAPACSGASSPAAAATASPSSSAAAALPLERPLARPLPLLAALPASAALRLPRALACGAAEASSLACNSASDRATSLHTNTHTHTHTALRVPRLDATHGLYTAACCPGFEGRTMFISHLL
jgi:hypothetical protein